jgi:hypothetical protein
MVAFLTVDVSENTRRVKRRLTYVTRGVANFQEGP